MYLVISVNITLFVYPHTDPFDKGGKLMRMTKRAGNFFLVLLFNMLLNIEWTIPAWILLALHYLCDWNIIWFWVALGVWLLNILLWMSFIGYASNCGSEKPHRENKNPYSNGTKK